MLTIGQKRAIYLDDQPRDVRRSVRAASMMEAIGGRQITTVVDVGCGLGQDLLPFGAIPGVAVIGTDYSLPCCRETRRLLREERPQAGAAIVCASAERVPLRSASCDVVICRGVLPYVDNDRALAELSRILKPEGVLFLKVLARSFYIKKIFGMLRQRRPKMALYAMRVLVSGTLFNLLGRQARPIRWISPHSYVTPKTLDRCLLRHGLEIVRPMVETAPYAPSYLVRKRRAEAVVMDKEQRLAA